MAYTQEDLTRLDAAIAARGSGQQVTDIQSGDRRIRYADTPMGELLALRDRMAREVGAAAVTAGQPRPARAFRGAVRSGY